MTFRLNYDFKLMAIVAVLLGVGLPMVFSASHLLAYRSYNEATYFLQRQAAWVAVGFVTMIVFSQIPYTFWRRVSIPMMVGTIAILAALLAMAVANNGARRWLSDGSFQPSEVAKLVTVIYVGHWLASRQGRLSRVSYGLIPFYVIVGGVAGLVVGQPDLSTAIVVVVTALAMFFVGGAPLLQLSVSSVALTSVAVSFLVFLVPWRLQRLLIFVDPLRDNSGDGYQIYQMLLAMGSGGWTGNGFSSLTGTIGYLPASHTDAIFAVIGNDFGLIGCSFVILMFVLLARRGMLIAERAADPFGHMLATGITVWLVSQALLNVASTTSSIPFTGIPLPFISFGGSALVSAMAGIGVLLNIARYRPSVRAGAREPGRTFARRQTAA
jgi:cell division protein FtsW